MQDQSGSPGQVPILREAVEEQVSFGRWMGKGKEAEAKDHGPPVMT